ncbi:MAG: SAM-dependent methyltransferase [Streptosporangiaceae bacterium]
MERPSWAPGEIELERPSIARVYDSWLGGSHNFAVDREMADEAVRAWPGLLEVMRANRAFLGRAVRFLVGEGVRQFLDLGSGIPTVGNVHEVAQEVAPEARVVYVDLDPVAVAHSQAILARNERATVVQADLGDPERVLADPEARRLLDLGEPVGLLMVAVLHFLSDRDDPWRVVARYRDAVLSGSYVAITHGGYEGRDEPAARVSALYRQSAHALSLRSRERIEALFDGFELVEPGFVHLAWWRPDSEEEARSFPEGVPGFGGVGRKP